MNLRLLFFFLSGLVYASCSTIHEAKDKIFKSAKFSGIIPFGNYDWKDVFEMGFDLTTAGTELSILRDSSRRIIKEFRN